MKRATAYAAIAYLALQPFAYADVSYKETTKNTGGSLMGMMKLAGVFSSQARQANIPTVATIAIHGNRMVRSSAHEASIIDLDQHTITIINHDKHTYSVVTFQQIAEGMQKAAAQNTKASQNTNSQGDAQIRFSAHVSSTGATRNIDGRVAKEEQVAVTMIADAKSQENVQAGMAATSEMWIVSEIPGMAEFRSFGKRMEQELAVDIGAPTAGLLSAQPGGAEAMANLKKEASKLAGIPVLQVTRVGISTDGRPLPPPSVAPVPDASTGDSHMTADAKSAATGAGTSAAASKLGRFGNFGRMLGGSALGSFGGKKPSSSSDVQKSAQDNAADSVLLESQTELSDFSTVPADPSLFEVPAGYKQVKSPFER